MDYSLLLAIERRTDNRLRGASNLVSCHLRESAMMRDSLNTDDLKSSNAFSLAGFGAASPASLSKKIIDDESFASSRTRR